MEEQYSIAFNSIVDLAHAMNVTNIKDTPGLWEVEVGRYLIKVNGHKEAIDNILPFHAYIEYNGWPFGIINPYTGTMGAGSEANEDDFINVLKDEIKRIAK